MCGISLNALELQKQDRTTGHGESGRPPIVPKLQWWVSNKCMLVPWGLIPRPPPIFIFQFVMTLIHGSGKAALLSLYYCQSKPMGENGEGPCGCTLPIFATHIVHKKPIGNPYWCISTNDTDSILVTTCANSVLYAQWYCSVLTVPSHSETFDKFDL